MIATTFRYARNVLALVGLYFAAVLLGLYASGSFNGACH